MKLTKVIIFIILLATVIFGLSVYFISQSQPNSEQSGGLSVEDTKCINHNFSEVSVGAAYNINQLYNRLRNEGFKAFLSQFEGTKQLKISERDRSFAEEHERSRFSVIIVEDTEGYQTLGASMFGVQNENEISLREQLKSFLDEAKIASSWLAQSSLDSKVCIYFD